MIRLYPAIFFILTIGTLPVLSNDNEFEQKYFKAKETITANIDLALDLAMETKLIAETNRDLKQLGQVHWLMAYIYDLKGDIGNAGHFYYNAAEIFDELGETKKVTRIMESAGTLAMNEGFADIALTAYKKRLEYARDLDSYKEEAEAHFDIGLAYRSAGNFTSSVFSFLEAQKLMELNMSTKNFDLMSMIYNELGLSYKRTAIAYDDQQYFDSARTCYLKALEFAETNLNRFHPANNLGNIYLTQGDLTTAREWFMKSIAYATDIDSRRVLIPTYNNLGKVHFAKGEFELADSLFGESLSLNLKEYTIRQIIDDKTIHRLDFHNNDELATSYTYLDSIQLKKPDTRILVERLQNEENKRQILEAIAFRNTLKVELAQKDREVKRNERNATIRQYSIIALIIVVCGGVIYYLSIRLNRVNSVRKSIKRKMAEINKRFNKV